MSYFSFVLSFVASFLAVLYSPSDGTVLKPVQKPPRGQREIHFYESIWGEGKHPVQKLIPRYYGLLNETTLDGTSEC